MHWKNPETLLRLSGLRLSGDAERVAKFTPDIVTTSPLRSVCHAGIEMSTTSVTQTSLP
jgi:hypothetical protein